jgi:hypothetical protein
MLQRGADYGGIEHVIPSTVVSWIVQGVAAFVVACSAGLLLAAWRDREAVAIDDRIVALVAMCVGVLFGVAWELVQFLIDWIIGSDLQLSNLDTMTDLLWNNVGAVVGGACALWVYCRLLDAGAREQLGTRASWLFDGPSRVLDKHGFLMTLVVALALAIGVAAVWFAGRPMPGFQIA